MNLQKRCRLIPKSSYGIPDLLPLGRIHEPVIIDLNQKEVRRCMSYAEVYEILEDNTEILIDEKNFDENYDRELTDNSEYVEPEAEDDNPIIPDMPNVVTSEVTGVGTGGLSTARFY